MDKGRGTGNGGTEEARLWALFSGPEIFLRDNRKIWYNQRKNNKSEK